MTSQTPMITSSTSQYHMEELGKTANFFFPKESFKPNAQNGIQSFVPSENEQTFNEVKVIASGRKNKVPAGAANCMTASVPASRVPSIQMQSSTAQTRGSVNGSSVSTVEIAEAKDAYQVEGNLGVAVVRPKISSSSSVRRANNLATIGFPASASATGTTSVFGNGGRIKQSAGSPKVMSPKKDIFWGSSGASSPKQTNNNNNNNKNDQNNNINGPLFQPKNASRSPPRGSGGESKPSILDRVAKNTAQATGSATNTVQTSQFQSKPNSRESPQYFQQGGGDRFDTTFNLTNMQVAKPSMLGHSSSGKILQLPALPAVNQNVGKPFQQMSIPMNSSKFTLTSNPKSIAKYAQISLTNNNNNNNNNQDFTEVKLLTKQPRGFYGTSGMGDVFSQQPMHNVSQSTQEATPESSVNPMSSPKNQQTGTAANSGTRIDRRNPTFSPAGITLFEPSSSASAHDIFGENSSSYNQGNQQMKSRGSVVAAAAAMLAKKTQFDDLRVDYFPDEIVTNGAGSTAALNMAGGTLSSQQMTSANSSMNGLGFLDNSLPRGVKREQGSGMLKRGELHSNSMKSLQNKRNTLNLNLMSGGTSGNMGIGGHGNGETMMMMRNFGQLAPQLDTYHQQSSSSSSSSQAQPKQLAYQSLKVYFEQQQVTKPMAAMNQYESLGGNLGGFNSNINTMKKSQSITTISSAASRMIQLEPIRLELPALGQIPSTSSTKKFLTRKPQTKILNRVFSSKADVKPNKNVFVKNAPMTANSQMTTNSPLFSVDESANTEQGFQMGNFNSNYHRNNFVANNNDDRFNVLAVPSKNPRRHFGELQRFPIASGGTSTVAASSSGSSSEFQQQQQFGMKNFQLNSEAGVTSSIGQGNDEIHLRSSAQQKDQMMMAAAAALMQRTSSSQQQLTDFKAYRQLVHNPSQVANSPLPY